MNDEGRPALFFCFSASWVCLRLQEPPPAAPLWVEEESDWLLSQLTARMLPRALIFDALRLDVRHSPKHLREGFRAGVCSWREQWNPSLDRMETLNAACKRCCCNMTVLEQVLDPSPPSAGLEFTALRIFLSAPREDADADGLYTPVSVCVESICTVTMAPSASVPTGSVTPSTAVRQLC